MGAYYCTAEISATLLVLSVTACCVIKYFKYMDKLVRWNLCNLRHYIITVIDNYYFKIRPTHGLNQILTQIWHVFLKSEFQNDWSICFGAMGVKKFPFKLIRFTACCCCTSHDNTTNSNSKFIPRIPQWILFTDYVQILEPWGSKSSRSHRQSGNIFHKSVPSAWNWHISRKK